MKRTHVVGVALALALSMTAPVAAMAAASGSNCNTEEQVRLGEYRDELAPSVSDTVQHTVDLRP